ncbi:MAG TPA: DUF6531 domain-containing protein [Thermoanaerobaculia bacterium]|nr:DUF6531 domain-containing protein [Thermoanaerobaculia bacterium]
MRLPVVAVAVLFVAVSLPAAADCPAVMSLSGPDAQHIVTITGHTEGACAGSRVDLDILGANYPSLVKHCDQFPDFTPQCDETWIIDTTCWPTGVYTARVTGRCSVLNETGSCGVAGTPGQNQMSFSIDSTPRITSLMYSPDPTGNGQVSVGFEFPNETAGQARTVETLIDGVHSLSKGDGVPMSGTWTYPYSSECWVPGQHTLTAVARGCSPEMTGQQSLTFNVTPVTTVSASWANDTLTVAYKFGNTGQGTGKARTLLVSVDGGGFVSYGVQGGFLPEGSATFPMRFDCGTGTHRIKVKAIGCGEDVSWRPEYHDEKETTAEAKECEEQTTCRIPSKTIADEYRADTMAGITVGAGPSCPCVGGPVSVASGDVSLSIPLFTIGGEPLPLDLALTYHSTPLRNAVPLRLGPSWTHSFNTSLTVVTPYRLQLFTPTGDRVFFDKVGEENRWVAGRPAMIEDEIVLGAAGYELKFVVGGSVSFAPYNATMARWTATTDRWGNTITGAYDAADRLTTITDAEGRQVVLYYEDADPAHLTRVVLPGDATWRFRVLRRLSRPHLRPPSHRIAALALVPVWPRARAAPSDGRLRCLRRAHRAPLL